jgi:hypothetical protein
MERVATEMLVFRLGRANGSAANRTNDCSTVVPGNDGVNGPVKNRVISSAAEG